MVIGLSRRYAATAALLSTLALFMGAACEKQGTESVSTHQVFTDPKTTPLAEAVAAGDKSKIRKLIDEGADPNARGERGLNLLQWAMMNKSKAGLEALLEAGADPARGDDTGETVVHYAAKANDPAYLEILLAHKADPNTPNTVTKATPLMSALVGDREVQFRKLLEAGAKPNNADRQGDTALHLAAQINAFQRVLDLLQAGADPAAKNKQGATFQRYLNRTPENVLNEKSLRGRESVKAWLREHNVPVEEPPPAR